LFAPPAKSFFNFAHLAGSPQVILGTVRLQRGRYFDLGWAEPATLRFQFDEQDAVTAWVNQDQVGHPGFAGGERASVEPHRNLVVNYPTVDDGYLFNFVLPHSFADVR
jgi:hypothetical protein